MSKHFEDYKRCYGFKDIANKIDNHGTWAVYGEDPNCDFGGSHREPLLGYYEGVLRDVMEYAFTLKGFWSWGSGGRFKEVVVVKIDKNTAQEMQKLKEEKEALEKRLEELNKIVK